MELKFKKIIEDYVTKKNEESISFNVVIENLNELFSSILQEIMDKFDNKISFKVNLFGDYNINSNYDFYYPTHILIDYIVDDEDYLFSQKRFEKGNIGKIYSDAFGFKNNRVLTIQELSKIFYNQLSIKLKNASIYLRKNQISLKFLDFKFYIFFAVKSSDNFHNFSIKAKDYYINFNKTNENLIKKNLETKGKFFNLIKLYKVAELELILIEKLKINAFKVPYFYENLLYNIPNEMLFNEYLYDDFLASLIYLSNSNIQDFISSDGTKLINDNFKVYSKPYINSFDVYKVINQSKFFALNIEKILQNK